jgi:hypothetical protein
MAIEISQVQAQVLKGPVKNGVTDPYHILCSGEPFIVKFAPL